MGFRQVPGLEKELEFYSGPVAEPDTWLLPEVLRECHGLVGSRDSRACLSALDAKLTGLTCCCWVGGWVLEGVVRNQVATGPQVGMLGFTAKKDRERQI